MNALTTTLGVALLLAVALWAQETKVPTPPPVARKALLQAKLAPAKTVATLDVQEVTLAPGQKAPLHLHPCPTLGVVVEGTIAFQIEGQPVQHLRAGEAFYEPALARVARFDNEGSTPARFVVNYLLGPDERETVRLLDR